MNTNDDLHPVFRDIDLEHAAMRKLLACAHQVLANRTQTSSEVLAMLDSLLGFLRAHFQHEDEGGFFDQITEQSPRLSDRAEKVRDEHATLLSDFQTLRALAAQGETDDAWWSRLDSEFHRISKELMHHEHREEDLLQESFNDDVGTGD